ncbi:ABC transporter ATP-binding protein [Tepidibacter formicigenes]|jgi:peptide/nickel transport system ATP-binding protein|uniref:Peptide/nickel transport system ATP-binding protein n=1 Tax=Tepidibacter formicigenes DSM 15518 TaxID=1123349 RepID=A0A1M6M3A4_9FIRM|nr:ABC transporter ATP-binding protein [Tepidibacter formicigenes]SHJ77853.1 peptide/nickel transport system ATP-binding protein [Tepidibacter formicigenes DSM 15518]
MKNTLLEIKNLKITYNSKDNTVEAVKGISFNINKGETLGIIGESGSGKSSIAMAITSLLDNKAKISGEIIYNGIDITKLSEKEKNKYRWNKIAIVFQNRLEVLNPVLTIKEQIEETLKEHTNFSKEKIKNKIQSLLNMVGLDEIWINRYPHELSGGMRQKVLIAMAIACDPELLILDEPTCALDPISRNQIINLLKNIQSKNKFSMIIISHEISTIIKITLNIEVLYKGYILEEGLTKEVIKNPMHPYTRGLINSSPEVNPYHDLWGIPSNIKNKKNNGCVFYERCNQSIDKCFNNIPILEYVSLERKVACNRGGIVTVLEAKNINKTYKLKNKLIKACKNCNIDLKSGEIIALIGQSGSGKTTLANIISGYLKQDSGIVLFEGNKINKYETIRQKKGIQMVFQDPFSSINENFTVENAIKEPLDILKIEKEEKRKDSVIKALKNVQLPTDNEFINKKIYTLSGGQRQRIAIARSLIMEPKVLIADEISSMLDPSTKANILRLLKELQNKNGFSMIYITHDLTIARKIANRIFIMNDGEIIENGISTDIFNNPKCNFTKTLLKEGLFETI